MDSLIHLPLWAPFFQRSASGAGKNGGRLAPLVEFSFIVEAVVPFDCYDDMV